MARVQETPRLEGGVGMELGDGVAPRWPNQFRDKTGEEEEVSVNGTRAGFLGVQSAQHVREALSKVRIARGPQ